MRAVAECDGSGTDWRLGAHHFREAGAIDRMVEVVAIAIPTIMGNGQYALAGSFIAAIAPDVRPASLALITSRVDMQQGDYEARFDASKTLLDSGVSDPMQRDHAILNLMTLYLNYGDGKQALRFADELAAATSDDYMGMLADAGRLAVLAANDGSLDAFRLCLVSLARVQESDRAQHLGVTMLNLSIVALLQDDLERALKHSAESLASLESDERTTRDSAAARLIRAAALARLGDLAGALGTCAARN